MMQINQSCGCKPSALRAPPPLRYARETLQPKFIIELDRDLAQRENALDILPSTACGSETSEGRRWEIYIMLQLEPMQNYTAILV